MSDQVELSPYDELPVHQTTRPLTVVANTDPGFDDGYFFGVFSAEQQTFLFCGLRVNPNTDLDGGRFHLGYHGPGVSLEHDEFDVSRQPVDHAMYDGTQFPGLIGKEYVSEVVTTGPDGRVWTGAGHTELFLDGRFSPYGFES